MRKNRGKHEKMFDRSKLSFASRGGDAVCRNGKVVHCIVIGLPLRGSCRKATEGAYLCKILPPFLTQQAVPLPSSWQSLQTPLIHVLSFLKRKYERKQFEGHIPSKTSLKSSRQSLSATSALPKQSREESSNLKVFIILRSFCACGDGRKRNEFFSCRACKSPEMRE